MRKIATRVLITLLFLAFFAPLKAQMPQMQPLPVDTAYVTGKLDNGMTYFIRHNETPKGQANFYIAQRVGSMQEEENQRGLAHFLEHMCFNGTQHFKGNELINWLEGKGVKFGHDLNAHTGFDETIYKIPNVPTADKGVQDTCLWILHDWADGLLLDPEEIEKERGVIHEEWRINNKGQMRVLEKILPKMMNGSKYGSRLPIGIMEVVDNFKPQELRDYYETWYRPDNQAIIVVGDIDVKYIEQKIKEIFSPIKMPANPKTKEYFTIPENKGTIYAMGSDPEITQPVAELMFKFKPLIPREYRNTIASYPINYMEYVINTMLNSRYSEINNNPDAKFSGASASIGDFFVTNAESALSSSVAGKGDDILPGIEESYREFLRAVKGGFTVGEYERAKAEYLSQIEKQYNERKNVNNAVYVEECVRNFIDNQPMPGIEFENQIAKQIANSIPVDAINQTMRQLMLDSLGNVRQDNRVFLGLFPENGKFKAPTEEQIAAVLKKVEAEELEPYKDEMKSEPLIPEMPKPGKIVSEKELKGYGATEYTLSNGVKVVVKPTKFKENQIILNAISKQGYANLPADKAPAVKLLGGAISMATGLGEYTTTDLQKYLQGKQVRVSASPSLYNSSISGSSTVKDLPTMMELLYMTFKDYRITEKEFNAFREMARTGLENQVNDPQYVFGNELMSTLFKSPLRQQLKIEDLDKASSGDVQEIVRGVLRNPADYTFFFVGTIDPATFKPLMEQYLGSLPATKPNAPTKLNPDTEIAKGKISKTESTKMQTPQVQAFLCYGGLLKYTPKNKLAASVASDVLSNRVLKKVREEMGATYSIGASGSLSRGEGDNFFIQIPASLKPELTDEAIKSIQKIVNDATTDITEEEIAPFKEYMLKAYKKGLEENSEWAQVMAAETINGVPTWLNQAQDIEALTKDDVMKALKDMLKQGNFAIVILNPAEK